jgi:hypothetical protein
MARWHGVFVGGFHHANLGTARDALIPKIDPPKFTRRWWFGDRASHTPDDLVADLQEQKDHHRSHNQAGDRYVHLLSVPLQTFDDGGVGQAATFTHRLQRITTTDTLKFVQHRRHNAST